MPQMDMRRKYTYGKKRKTKKKESFAVSLFTGLFPWFGDKPSDVVRKLVFLASIAALAVSLIVIINFYYGEKDPGVNPSTYGDKIGESYAKITVPINPKKEGASQNGEIVASQENAEIIEKYYEFYERNNSFVGFISLDPYLNYPVAQAENNQYYLKHNYDNQITENGTIFADFECEFTPATRPNNTIIYGHNLLTHNGFQPLCEYRKSFKFLKDNPIIKFDTLYEAGTYKIFSVFLTNTTPNYGEVFDYWNYVKLDTSAKFYDFVAECLDRSYYHTGVDLEYGDELLTLSTCDFSGLKDLRLVVVARRVREDEDPGVDPETFTDNSGKNADGLYLRKMFKGYYDYFNSGRGWAGRNWDTSLVKGLDEYLKSKGE